MYLPGGDAALPLLRRRQRAAGRFRLIPRAPRPAQPGRLAPGWLEPSPELALGAAHLAQPDHLRAHQAGLQGRGRRRAQPLRPRPPRQLGRGEQQTPPSRLGTHAPPHPLLLFTAAPPQPQALMPDATLRRVYSTPLDDRQSPHPLPAACSPSNARPPTLPQAAVGAPPRAML